jgi:hypothetical protein
MHSRLDLLKKKYSQVGSDLRQAKRTVALAAGIREFLRERITIAHAEEEIKKALGSREENFLEVARTRIYANPSSPYLRLLKFAGCEYADLTFHVRHHGLESTLERLAKEGVYLTSEEYKGTREVVRGGESFAFVSTGFMGTERVRGFVAQSSGMRSNVMTFDRLAEKTFEEGVFLSAHNLLRYSHAVYDGVLPVAGGLNYLLTYAKLGVTVDRWFARLIPVNSRVEGWYHYLTTYLIVSTAKWYTGGFPAPEMTEIANIDHIVDWILKKNQEGKPCCIKTAASNASRIARVAWDKGVSLEGTKFRVGGEPFTKAKRNVIERVGASAIPNYGSNTAGAVGQGCANPVYTDDLHALEHRLALIRHPKPLTNGGPPIQPLLFTTLNPQETRLLLNVDNGDYAELEERNCGCALEKVGFKLHLHHIRSFEKFTSEGMNYFYGDLFELFENILPAEFGGGPGDYQLVEEEDSQGQTRLSLLVNPALGSVDEARLLCRLRMALSEGSRGNRFMSQLWQNSGTFRIIRKTPYASPRGKILPLHIPR